MRARAPLVAIVLAGCDGRRSALAPVGREAGELAPLCYALLVGAGVIWLLVNGLFLYATRLDPRPLSRRLAESVTIAGGIAFPLFVLGGLLLYALSIMPPPRAPGEGLTLHVSAERWWWRVAYLRDGERSDEAVVVTSQVRLPRGRRTEVKLDSAEVTHSFSIPALADKVDTDPGRESRLALEPERAGTFRGRCAGFCGTSDARPTFEAVVMEPDDFDAWLEREREDARVPDNALARRGLAVFLAEGCGACHRIRGTPALGLHGPDLTHVGGRVSVAAGALPRGPESIAHWIAPGDVVEHDVDTPAYDHLGAGAVEALGAYLAGLR